MTVLLLGGLATGVRGQWDHPRFGGYIKVPTVITGIIVCADCSLVEAQKANPKMHDLYLLEHEEGQAVMQVNQILNPDEERRWETIGWPPRLWVRANDEVFRKLTAEENLSQEVKITALLRSSRTLDIFDVEVVG